MPLSPAACAIGRSRHQAESSRTAIPRQLRPFQLRRQTILPNSWPACRFRQARPSASLSKDPAWQEHAGYFEKAFAKLNTRQLAKLHDVAKHLSARVDKNTFPVVYYMFSGPDLLYVDQFFPKASVYIMCGKEPLGPPPDPSRIGDFAGAFHNLEGAMKVSLHHQLISSPKT